MPTDQDKKIVVDLMREKLRTLKLHPKAYNAQLELTLNLYRKKELVN